MAGDGVLGAGSWWQAPKHAAPHARATIEMRDAIIRTSRTENGERDGEGDGLQYAGAGPSGSMLTQDASLAEYLGWLAHYYRELPIHRIRKHEEAGLSNRSPNASHMKAIA